METLKKHFASFRLRAEFWRLEYFSRSRAKDFATIKSKRMPVVLVAGIYASGKSLRPLKKFLEQKGWPVSLAPAEKNYAAVPILAKRLEERILAIPAKKVQIVAHSLGGITALVALKTPKVFAKVAQVITLGSPLQGCALGKFAFWELKKIAISSRPIRKKFKRSLPIPKLIGSFARCAPTLTRLFSRRKFRFCLARRKIVGSLSSDTSR